MHVVVGSVLGRVSVAIRVDGLPIVTRIHNSVLVSDTLIDSSNVIVNRVISKIDVTGKLSLAPTKTRIAAKVQAIGAV